jgi:hypothetical protein
VLEMHNSWKEIHISLMIFINTELDFKIEIRKRKIREIHNSKKGIHNLYFQTTLSMFEVDNPWKYCIFKVQI